MTPAEMVDQAAAWLDVRHAGWHDKIDLDTLRMMDGCKCIGGQMSGGDKQYWMVLDKGLIEDVDTRGENCAFAEPDALPFWRRAILERRETAAPATVRERVAS